MDIQNQNQIPEPAELDRIYAQPDYKRSRRAYAAECAFEYFVSLMVTGAFLTKLLTYVGFDDAACGLISSFISLAFLFELFSVFVVQKITNTKRFCVLIHTTGQLFFMLIYLMPFMPFAAAYRRIAVPVCLCIAYFGNYFVTSSLYKWGNSYVDPRKRGSFSAVKEILSLIGGMTVSLIAGRAVDRYYAAGKPESAFIFLALSILLYCLSDFVMLLLIKNTVRQKKADGSLPFRTVLRETVGNRRFLKVILLYSLYQMTRYASWGFMSTFKLNDLLFTVTEVELFNIAAFLGRIAASRPFGALTDRKGYLFSIEIAFVMMMASYIFLIFTTPSTRLFILFYEILNTASFAGSSQNLINITYNYVDTRCLAEANAIKDSIGGTAGFLAAMLSSRLLGRIQADGNTFFGLHMYGQQVLGAVSLIIVSAAMAVAFLMRRKQNGSLHP